jgi:hypothetical protein
LAQILDVDPFAILAAMEIRSPWFAVCCAERKLMTVMMVASRNSAPPPPPATTGFKRVKIA